MLPSLASKRIVYTQRSHHRSEGKSPKRIPQFAACNRPTARTGLYPTMTLGWKFFLPAASRTGLARCGDPQPSTHVQRDTGSCICILSMYDFDFAAIPSPTPSAPASARSRSCIGPMDLCVACRLDRPTGTTSASLVTWVPTFQDTRSPVFVYSDRFPKP